MGSYVWRGIQPHDAPGSLHLPGGTAILQPSTLQLDPRGSSDLVLLNGGTVLSAKDEENDESSAWCLAVNSSAGQARSFWC
ncbi:hypothetical protein GT037_008257 [Alternaria burnsii]|uniref:Uncharacterized protein n=1 Tax=Alternaria burnsii TaxID=1187904 RepID=A0A8H7AY21_9PLEO|nr:uncharacterized protein GT037_008257 [Alternaria burnsii]KAF7673642.1 hypothetical protein GT037_008257 [Alternaria burnsii]